MPTPQSGESRDDFVSRCIPEVLRDETAESQEQAVAICFDIWRRRDNQAADDEDSRYMTLRGLAQTAELRTAQFRGREHLVVPVVAMVGNSIVRPMNSEDAELVPSEVLRRAPIGWDGRPVVMGHPTDGNGSANRPRTLENLSFGQLFNTRFHDGRLKTEAWIDVEAATALGGDSKRVLERVRNHETVEVSIGAWITGEHVDDTGGFGFVWTEVVPDHLAMLPEDARGACSVDMGCGAPRVMAKREHTSTHIKQDPGVAQLRHSVASRARRPTFDGTESTEWSAPTFADYVSALFDGDDPPSSVGDAPASLKRAIAARTLLGESDADNFRDLAFFPVVNPSNDNLNERALRAVIGGRGSQANISEDARTSAQNMARRLLNSEFDADLEVAEERQEDLSMKQQEKAGSTLLSKAMAGFFQFMGSIARQAQDDGMSDTDLHMILDRALREDVPQFDGIIDVFPDTGVVVFAATRDGEFTLFHRTFSLDDDERSVTLNDDMQAVEPVTEFKPVAASDEGAHNCECEGECQCAHAEDGDEPSKDKDDEPVAARRENGGATAATKGTTPKEDVTMSKTLKALVGRLIINEDTPFTGDHEETLLAMPEDTLKALEEKYNEEPYIAPEPDPEPEPMTEEEWMEQAPRPLREMVRRYQDEESERRNLLINSLARAQNQFTKKQLESKSTEDLEALCGLCKINAPKRDYSGRGLAAAFADANAEGVPSPPNMQRYIQAKRQGKSNHEAMREARSA